MIQSNDEIKKGVQINRNSFPDADEFMEHIEHSIVEATELRNEMMQAINPLWFFVPNSVHNYSGGLQAAQFFFKKILLTHTFSLYISL